MDQHFYGRLSPTTLVAGVCLLVTFAIYAPVLGFGYVYEDLNDNRAFQQGWIGFDQQLHQTYQPGHLHFPSRPLTEASYFLTHQFATNQTRADHAVSLGLHLLTVGLFAWLALQLCDGLGAFLATAIFAWHPIQVEAVSYIAARADLWLGLALVLALIGVETRKPALIGFAWCLALGAKELGVMVLPATGLYASYRRRPWPEYAWTIIVVIAGLLALDAMWRRFPLLGVHAFSVDAFLRHLAEFWSLLGRLVWPTHLAVVHDDRWITPLAETVSALVLIPLAWCAFVRRQSVALGVCVMLLLLSPRMAFAVDDEALHEHLLYMPMIAVALSIGIAWSRLSEVFDMALAMLANDRPSAW